MEISTLLGAIDGKNAVMETQTRSDPRFKNYKKDPFYRITCSLLR